MNESSFGTRLLGLCLLIAVGVFSVILFRWVSLVSGEITPQTRIQGLTVQAPVTAQEPVAPIAPLPTQSSDPVPEQTELITPVGECRATSDGFLGAEPTFGVADGVFTHADYWTAGELERAVILPGGVYEAPSGYSGRWWSYTGDCAEAQVRAMVNAHITRRGPNHAGWGDNSLFTQVS